MKLENNKGLNKLVQAMVITTGTLGLAACGGGSSSGTTASTVSTGTFVDSAVSGVAYQTATQSGKTDANGQYKFKAGETVTFSIGGVTLPPVSAKSVVTPYDMASNSSDTQTPLNVGLLLQSYDADGDPSNGIEITDAVENKLKDVTIDSNDLSSKDTTGFKAMFTTGTEPDSWKTDTEVENHLENADGVVGTWMSSSASSTGLVYLRFLPSVGGNPAQYLLLSDQEGTATDVLQTGTYTVDKTAETITLTKVTGQDSSTLDATGTVAYHYSDSDDMKTLSLEVSDQEAQFNRVVPLKDQAKTADAINGVWKFDSTSTGSNKLAVFNRNGSYQVFSLEGGAAGAVVYEKGTYTIDSTPGEFSFTPDTSNPLDDGGKGFSGTTLNHYAVSNATSLTLSDSNGSASVSLTKILPY